MTTLELGVGGVVEKLTKKKKEEEKDKNKRACGHGQQCHDYRRERVGGM